jgi:hypothetical protein
VTKEQIDQIREALIYARMLFVRSTSFDRSRSFDSKCKLYDDAIDILKAERKEVSRLEYWVEQAAIARMDAILLREALHSISLGSSNSMTIKEDLGKKAREALKEVER